MNAIGVRIGTECIKLNSKQVTWRGLKHGRHMITIVSQLLFRRKPLWRFCTQRKIDKQSSLASHVRIDLFLWLHADLKHSGAETCYNATVLVQMVRHLNPPLRHLTTCKRPHFSVFHVSPSLLHIPYFDAFTVSRVFGHCSTSMQHPCILYATFGLKMGHFLNCGRPRLLVSAFSTLAERHQLWHSKLWRSLRYCAPVYLRTSTHAWLGSSTFSTQKTMRKRYETEPFGQVQYITLLKAIMAIKRSNVEGLRG